jgi:hypothetical protein
MGGLTDSGFPVRLLTMSRSLPWLIASLSILATAACGKGGETGGSTGSGSGGAGSGGTGGSGGSPLVDTPPPPHAACPLDAFPAAQRITFNNGPNGNSILVDDQTWTKDHLYLIDGPIQIHANLTIEAGTTVCVSDDSTYGDNGRLEIWKTGALAINGTAMEPVVLTSKDPAAYWQGVAVLHGAKVALHHTRIHHAGELGTVAGLDIGAGDEAVLDDVILVGLDKTPALSSFRDFAPGVDVWIASIDGAPPVHEGPALHASADAAATLTTSVRFSAALPSAARAVAIVGDVTHPVSWPNVGVPYVISGLSIGGDPGGAPASLTLSPGTIVKLQNTIYVGYADRAGDLIAVGAEGHPITITQDDTYLGGLANWRSLEFGNLYSNKGFDPKVSRLSFVHLELGGNIDNELAGTGVNCHDLSASAKSGTGMVKIHGLGAYAGPAIDHTSFDHSQTDGVRADAFPDKQTHITTSYTDPALGNTFTDVAGKPEWPTTACP